MTITHATVKAAGERLFAVADWNVGHIGTATPDTHGNEKHSTAYQDAATYGTHDHSAGDPTQVSHADLTNVSSDQHHAKSHAITSASDHTSAATSGKMLKADANGLPVNATNTDADVADAVTKKHSQNTDTALGSGCEAADHGAAATDQVVNVCYGTGDPPAAATTTEGTLFVKYTA